LIGDQAEIRERDVMTRRLPLETRQDMGEHGAEAMRDLDIKGSPVHNRHLRVPHEFGGERLQAFLMRIDTSSHISATCLSEHRSPFAISLARSRPPTNVSTLPQAAVGPTGRS
jgi:hypothetical protein